MEPFDYKFVDKIERPGTRTEELYGGGWGKSTSWVGYAKQFADIVNGCAFEVLFAQASAQRIAGCGAVSSLPCTQEHLVFAAQRQQLSRCPVRQPLHTSCNSAGSC